jgi:hypothetical protein
MGNNVIIAVGEASSSFRGMVQLNESAADIWKFIGEGLDREQIIDAMMEKYDAQREIIEADVCRSIDQFASCGMIEI